MLDNGYILRLAVTLRDPVARSISHFVGRWNIRKPLPVEDTARGHGWVASPPTPFLFFSHFLLTCDLRMTPSRIVAKRNSGFDHFKTCGEFFLAFKAPLDACAALRPATIRGNRANSAPHEGRGLVQDGDGFSEQPQDTGNSNSNSNSNTNSNNGKDNSDGGLGGGSIEWITAWARKNDACCQSTPPPPTILEVTAWLLCCMVAM